jgi:hypothetical protein
MVLFCLAYASSMPSEERWQKVRLYRFTSNDGMSWSEGEWVFPRSREDLKDKETGEYATNMDLFSCYYDIEDEEYPYKGWIWHANWGYELEGAHLMKSKDGRKWIRGPMIVNGYSGGDDPSHLRFTPNGRDLRGPGDVTVFYHDEVKDRFLGTFKFFNKEPVEHGNRLRSRAYAFMDRMDRAFDNDKITHVELVPPAAEKNGDMPHDEYYASTGWRYESMWLGGLKIWHGEGDYPYSAAGCAFYKLICSRDGLNWSKVQFNSDNGIPEVFIPNGPEGGNRGRNDGGYMTEFSTGPFVSGTELIYYYGSSSYGKNHPDEIRVSGGGIFRSRLRIDGFVSVNRGILTTKPLSFTGCDLTVNSNGPIQIDLLSKEGVLLGSATVNGDSLRHEVDFSGKTIGELARGKAVRLRFEPSEKAYLYSFTIW